MVIKDITDEELAASYRSILRTLNGARIELEKRGYVVNDFRTQWALFVPDRTTINKTETKVTRL